MMKALDRKRKRIYHSERRSEKWKNINKIFNKEVKSAKSIFYRNIVQDLKEKNPGQWYSTLKKITSYENKYDLPKVEEINHLNDDQQCERIADEFSYVQNQYNELHKDDIQIPDFSENEIPIFHPSQVWKQLTKMKTNKSSIEGDLPAKLFKTFAAYFADPLTDIINTSIRRGEYPDIWKSEISTPIPKTHPTLKTSDLRNISGLLNCDRIAEKLIAELMISDMTHYIDPSQYGNQKGKSINHYLIRMIHRILTSLDNNSRKQTFAVVANMIDWSSAFPRQCPKLGIQSFIQNGVRPALIPVLINYFQNRKMSVKWHGSRSVPRLIKGGGPQGATIGLLEYLSQSNNSADCVSEQDRYKFVDDLTTLEVVNLLTVGITCFNIKSQVPNDVPTHNQFIPPENLESQQFLDTINEWTSNQKMLISQKKTKTMIFNYTNDHQFTTRLTLNGQNVDVIPETKLLGTIIQNDLKWDKNTANIVRKANARMALIRKLSEFGTPTEDLKLIYILYIRSILEQSSVVWHTSLSEQNIKDLERVQKSALKIILKNRYQDYGKSLTILDLQTLKQRRDKLSLEFAQKNTRNKTMNDMFKDNTKHHTMTTRKYNKIEVLHCNTDRLMDSAIPQMQRMLNTHYEQKSHELTY